jgi:hypothetical protein
MRWRLRTAAAALTLAATAAVHSQPSSPPPAASAAALPSASPAKKALAARLVALQQPALEQLARNLVEQPVRQLMMAGEQALRAKIPVDRQEAVARQIQDEVRKYLDEAYPLVRDRAVKLGTTQLGPAFEERFTEEELRQIVTFQESTANRKLQQVLPEISNGLAQKLVGETRGTVEPKFKALDASLSKLLGIAAPSGGTSAPSTGPAKTGSAPKASPAAPAASRP